MKVHPKRMSWIIKRLSMIVGGFALLLVIIAAVQYRQKSVVANDGLKIKIINNEEENKFIKPDDVEELLFREFKHAIVGQPLELIDIEAIETVLEEDVPQHENHVCFDVMYST